ncbi:hypothetical protein NW762_014756 [Fusarium torreyae]|uniref:Uncharacterized protein n=1 Tax=Fusarium torreyae TaxID=1237075 RepID=A0A9W8V6B1_9HYPO|nr:hypothetical protein NW762_014756 [Fusarium torreyae]
MSPMADRLVPRWHPQPESQPQQQPSIQPQNSNTALSTPQPSSHCTVAVSQGEQRVFLNATDPASIARLSLPPEPSQYSPCETQQQPHTPGITILPRRTRAAPEPLPPTAVQVNNTWRRETYNNKCDETISWLNNAWGGPYWIPKDLRQCESKPAVQDDGSALRQAVSHDQAERLRSRKPRLRAAVPPSTAAIAKSALETLSTSDDAPQWPAVTIDFDEETFIPPESEPCLETTTLVSEDDNIRMPPAQEASTDIDMADVPITTLKRRSSKSAPVSTPAAKKQRTAALHTARQIFKDITSNTPMSSDTMDLLARVVGDQGPT